MGQAQLERDRSRGALEFLLVARERGRPVGGGGRLIGSCTAAPSLPAPVTHHPRGHGEAGSARSASAPPPAGEPAAGEGARGERAWRCRRSPARHGVPPPHSSRCARRRSRCREALTEAGVRRYGFHGLSYEHVASALPRAAAIARRRGRGPYRSRCTSATAASMRALAAGSAAWPARRGSRLLDGPGDGQCRRSGSLDPGAILLPGSSTSTEMDARAIERLLLIEGQSGCLGVSGLSSDMRAQAARFVRSACPGGGGPLRAVRTRRVGCSWRVAA